MYEYEDIIDIIEPKPNEPEPEPNEPEPEPTPEEDPMKKAHDFFQGM